MNDERSAHGVVTGRRNWCKGEPWLKTFGNEAAVLRITVVSVSLESTARCTRSHCRYQIRHLVRQMCVTALGLRRGCTVVTAPVSSLACLPLACTQEETSTDLTQHKGRSPSVVLSCMPERRSKGLDTVDFLPMSFLRASGKSGFLSNDALDAAKR